MSRDATSSPPAALQVDPTTLPDDAAVLKSLVAQLFAELQSRDGRISDLEHRLSLLVRKLYGNKSEKLDPRQTSLFDLFAAAAEDQAAVTEQASPRAAGDNSPDETPAATTTAKQQPGHGRRRLPDQLQRREVLHDLTDPEKEALGGVANLVVIGREVTEQLEWEPSCLYVIRHVQLTYARRQLLPESGLTLAEQNVVTASKPPQPIAGGLPGPGLLAQVLTSKYADHRVQGEAVSKMREGLSWPGDRTWPQTSPNCGGQESSWEASGANGVARPRQVRFAKSNESEPLMKCRNRTDDVKTGEGWLPWDQHGRCLYLAHVASGIKTARSRIRLGYGTLEPVVSMTREKLKRTTRKGESTDARHRGGTTRSSVEGRVIRLERRGRVIQSLDNRSTASAGGTHD